MDVVVPDRSVRCELGGGVRSDEDERRRRPGLQRGRGVVRDVEGDTGGRGEPEQVAEQGVVTGGEEHGQVHAPTIPGSEDE